MLIKYILVLRNCY